MAIKSITEEEFYKYNVIKNPMAIAFGKEVRWFEEKENNILATIIQDTIDHDWSYVVLAKNAEFEFRAIDLEVSLATEEIAERKLSNLLKQLARTGQFQENLYIEQDVNESSQILLFTDINNEVKQYLKKHPEKLYDLSPRKFEELVASILEDMGLSVELTKATRDGGSDIIAQVKNSLTSFLILVECKKYSPDNKVDVGIVRSVAGVHLLKEPAKSIIVTTSTFTKDAKAEAQQLKGKIELKDYEDLKE